MISPYLHWNIVKTVVITRHLGASRLIQIRTSKQDPITFRTLQPSMLRVILSAGAMHACTTHGTPAPGNRSR